jgi:RimJ/RimL family protein N-acetyltransferase
MEQKEKPLSKWVTWRDRIDVEIRPLEPSEVEEFVRWIRSLEPKELAKLPCDVHDPGYPNRLRGEIMSGTVFRLVAWRDGHDIVGSMALYPGDLHWVRHTGRLVVVTDPSVRRSGIAVVMLDEMVRAAERRGIRKLYAELTSQHKAAQKLARRVGLRREATLRDHVIDQYGDTHDLYIYAVTLNRAQSNLNELMGRYVRLDHKL